MNAPEKLPTRIAEKIRFRKNGCWNWIACRDVNGYRRVRWQDENKLAHRVVYELLVGKIKAGLTLDHLCRNHSCVNPAHLDPVTLAVNKERGFSPAMVNRRKTRCPRGHKYDYVNPNNGKRRCRRCDIENQRVRRAA